MNQDPNWPSVNTTLRQREKLSEEGKRIFDKHLKKEDMLIPPRRDDIRKDAQTAKEEADKKVREGWEALKAQFKDSNKAMRFNEGKMKWGLVDFKSLEPLVQALMYGAEKYEPGNWRKGQDRMENLESAMRHLIAMMSGEIIDPESGVPHVGHLIACAMFNSYFDIVNPPGDNEHLFDVQVNK